MYKPPSSARCSRRCAASPRCWSRWRPRRWRCCTPGCLGSAGSSGCSQWWPRSRTWGCTWWPAPGTAGSRRAWRATAQKLVTVEHKRRDHRGPLGRSFGASLIFINLGRVLSFVSGPVVFTVKGLFWTEISTILDQLISGGLHSGSLIRRPRADTHTESLFWSHWCLQCPDKIPRRSHGAWIYAIFWIKYIHIRV